MDGKGGGNVLRRVAAYIVYITLRKMTVWLGSLYIQGLYERFLIRNLTRYSSSHTGGTVQARAALVYSMVRSEPLSRVASGITPLPRHQLVYTTCKEPAFSMRKTTTVTSDGITVLKYNTCMFFHIPVPDPIIFFIGALTAGQ